MGDVGVSGLEDAGFAALGGAPGLGLSRRTTSEIACPKAMVGRVIGKQGEVCSMMLWLHILLAQLLDVGALMTPPRTLCRPARAFVQTIKALQTYTGALIQIDQVCTD